MEVWKHVPKSYAGKIMFQFYDPQSYSVVVDNRNFLVRPRLNPTDNWAVKHWDVLEHRKFPYTKNNLKMCDRAILDNLETSYLNKIYLAGNATNPLYGFCYLATQTMFYLLQTNHLFSYSGLDDFSVRHWWLVDEGNGEIIDPTASQYDLLMCDPPYEVGKKRKWYGFRPWPQNRTLDLIQKMQPDAKRSKVLNLENLAG